jgi:hypothetical protein
MNSSVKTTLLYKVTTLAAAICAVAFVSPVFLASRWRTAEIHRIDLTRLNIAKNATVIQIWCASSGCTRYPRSNSLAELARGIGSPYRDQLQSHDGWGRPLYVLSWSDGYIIASAGADGILEPGLRSLLSRARDGDDTQIAPELEAFTACARAKTIGARAAGRHWYEDRNADIVSRTGTEISSNLLSDDHAVPPDVTARYAWTVSAPAALLFVALLFFRNRRARAMNRRPRPALGRRLVQVCCAGGLLLPFFLTHRWVVREKQPIRETFEKIAATAGALEQYRTRGVYPAGTSVPQIAPRIGSSVPPGFGFDGWGHPLEVRSWATRYVIASGGSDGKLDPAVTSLLSVTPGDDARFDRLARALQEENRRQLAELYHSPGPRWFSHSDYDAVYVAGQPEFVMGSPIENPDNSLIEAPPFVLRRYAFLVALPSLLILIGTFFIGRTRTVQEIRPRRTH